MGKTVAIANWKNLLGKTTTAVNLSASLAIQGFKILLLDLDAQAQTTAILLNQVTHKNMYSCIIDKEKLASILRSTIIPNLDLLPAHSDLDHLEMAMLDIDQKEQELKKVLADVKNNYDYIFIDCPAAPTLMTLNALTAADTLLIPLQCEYAALDNLSKPLNLVQTIQARLNPNLKLEGILITMYDKTLNHSNQIVYTLRSYFKTLIFETIIPKSSALSQNRNLKPLFITDKINNEGYLSYLKLAHEFLERN